MLGCFLVPLMCVAHPRISHLESSGGVCFILQKPWERWGGEVAWPEALLRASFHCSKRKHISDVILGLFEGFWVVLARTGDVPQVGTCSPRPHRPWFAARWECWRPDSLRKGKWSMRKLIIKPFLLPLFSQEDWSWAGLEGRDKIFC